MMKTSKELFSINLRYYRTSKGLTQEQLSEMLEISHSHYNEIETGKKNPSIHLIDKIVEVLQIEHYKFFLDEMTAEQAKNQAFLESLKARLIAEIDSEIAK